MQQDTIGFSLDISSNSKVASAWENFTSSGQFISSTVRPIISQAWEKSRELGIPPQIDRAPTVISAEEIEEKVKKEDLCRAGVSALSKLEDVLHETEHVVVLGDAMGRILFSVGHEQIRDRLEKINFRPGGDWAENVVGPNGVGTPLRLGRPEIVMGHEHYCQGWHPWVCYGAPIFSATTNAIMGTVDITGPVSNISKNALALAISVAQSVQSGLSIIGYHRRELLRELGRELLKRWPSDGVLILDENEYIVEFNQRALKYLKLNSANFLNRTISQLLPSLSGTVSDCSQSRSQLEIKIHTERETGILQPIKVRLQPVFKGEQCLGVALIITDLCQSSQSKALPVSQTPRSKYSLRHIKGSSKKIKNATRLASAAAGDPLQSNVLLIGETGTGKEMLAHSIHSESSRAGAPFIAINCAAIPKDLIESELFGYVPGAFTGARRTGLKGKFESAHNGTLFLDEINSMSLELQAKLLRVLDSMEITPVGGVESMLVNVRVIAAANEKIYPAVEEGEFRLDLFHRLNVFEITVPALSDRGNDIIELANDFLRTECHAAGRNPLRLAPQVVELLLNYKWPGNVRELHNICVRWVLTVAGDTVSGEDVPEKFQRMVGGMEKIIGDSLRTVSDELIRRTLEQTNNNISCAARILGIDRTTIYRRRKHW